MDKSENINNYNHAISLTERKNLMISGVKKIDNFDNEQFMMDTVEREIKSYEFFHILHIKK